jgi:hypothetical protein
MDLPDAEFDVSSDSLRGSSNALFRVLVTDGLRTSVAVAGPVTVRGHLPTVAILMPTGGMQYAAGDQIEFLGRAFDLDEGDLDDDSVVWTSDLAGEIGRGARFSVPAEDLPAGRHRIAAVATDSSGNTATNSVEITVGATRSPLLKLRREDGTLVFSWSRLDEGFGLEVTAGRLPAAGGTPDPDALIPAETSDDEEFVVRLPEPGSTRFYRLRRIDE